MNELESVRELQKAVPCDLSIPRILLLEEFAEAMSAYQQGRLEDSLQELAQCGAVILQIMETIEKEIKK